MKCLCEKCFPGWDDVEVLTIVPLSSCEECGVIDGRRNGGAVVHAFRSDPRMPLSDATHCHKPGCGKRTEVFGSKWCSACWYPSIDDDHARYRAYREDGYGVYQAKVMVGWADPTD